MNAVLFIYGVALFTLLIVAAGEIARRDWFQAGLTAFLIAAVTGTAFVVGSAA